MAVTAVSPAAAGAMGRTEEAAKLIKRPETPIPADVVVAYVHDAARGVVTVIHGDTERTYKDAALARRLLKAAHHSSKERR
jgi:hypothetical protein